MPHLQEARRVWTTQPPPNVGLSRTGWRSRIIAAIDARGALASRPVQRVGTPTVSQTAIGAALVGNNANLISKAFPGIAFPYTQLVVMGQLARTANNNVSAGPGDNSGNQFSGFQLSSAGGVFNRFLLRATNSGTGDSSFRQFATNASVSSASNVVLGASVISNSSIDVYWNGQLDNGTFGSSGGGPSTGSPTFGRLALGGIDRGTDIFADTGNDAALVVIVQGALSPDEHLEFARNWYSIYDEEDELVYFSAGGGGGSTGTSSTTLDNLTLSATASITAQGQASIALADVTLSATGASVNQGAASITLAGVTLSATGSITAQGQASITLADLTLAATGSITNRGAASITLADATIAAEGESTTGANGSAAITLDDVTLTAAGSITTRGAAAITLADLGLSAAGALTNRGQAAITLGALLLSASGANSDAVTYARAPRGGGYPATVPTTERYGMSNTKRPAMTNTRR